LDTKPLLKILIFEEQKDMWASEIFGGRKKLGIQHPFISVFGTTVQVL
jgi:hypothetical protein